jgi:DNA invertase Pin-like site-specific DNA recombinase
VVATYVEQVSGTKNERAELTKALAHCKRTGATLLVAKLDRVSRRVSFIAKLMESNIPLKVCEMPNSDAFQLHIYAALAERERQLISERTKQALAIIKSKGVKLGSPLNPTRALQAREFANTVAPYVEDIRKSGVSSWNGIAKALNEMGIKSARGGTWTQATIQRSMGYINP